MRLRRRREAAAAVQDPIGANIDAVVAIHAVAESQVDTHQRNVESLTAWLGRPQFFYGILVGVSLWMIANSFAHPFGLAERDDPPYFWTTRLTLKRVVRPGFETRDARMAGRRSITRRG